MLKLCSDKWPMIVEGDDISTQIDDLVKLWQSDISKEEYSDIAKHMRCLH